MTELFDSGQDFEPLGQDNPFYGLGSWDFFSYNPPDPYERIEKDVFEALNIDDFDGLLIRDSDVSWDELRGNRFENIREAILYLSDAGILAYGKVVLFETGEVGIAIGGSP